MLKLKGRGERNGKPVTFVMLGLSDMNIEKLRQHLPIAIFKEELSIEHDILIFWGTDEQSMVQRLEAEGFPVDELEIVPMKPH